VRYVELEFEAELEGRRSFLPRFPGATLRGALGYVLRDTVCQLRQADCRHCVLQAACPYPAIFEGLAPENRRVMRLYERIPQPFVLVVAWPDRHGMASSVLTWGVRLFGPACSYWPYVVHVYRTVGQRGLGKRRIRYRLRKVTDAVTGQVVWSPDNAEPRQPGFGNVLAGGRSTPDECTLRWVFSTPVRLALNSGHLSGLDLVLAGRRRLHIMEYFYGEGDEQGDSESGERLEAGQFTTLASRIRPWRLQRYSGRQNRPMSLYGLAGEIVIHGPWGRSGPWLGAVPLLHLGKATSFGLGRARWEVV